MKQNSKFLMYLLPLAFIFILIILLVSSFKRLSPESTVENFTPLPSLPLEISSRWATDSGLLKIDKEFKNLKEQTELLNFDQSVFYPPKINFGLELNP